MFAWPLVCIGLFVLLPLEAAAIWSMLGAYLLLPSNMSLDAPLLPPLDKMAVASISTFVLCWMRGKQAPTVRPPKLLYLFCFGYVLAPILTSFDNSYELLNPRGSIPGFYPIDGLKVAGRQFIALLPFFMAMRFLSTDSARRQLLKSLPTAITIYSLPMLWELRMSPQLHMKVYGYYPSDFSQWMRSGGFRPVVFTQHGLELAFIVSLAVICAVALVRAKGRILNQHAGLIAGYLGVLLALCKSLGPLLYAIVTAPIILFTRPRTWARIALAFTLLLCAYPVLRYHGWVPGQVISSTAGRLSSDRSASFETRYENEGKLLFKANQKPLFGWGTWGRNRVFDKFTGQDISITDGGWIIQFGMFGWLGYLSLFGLIAMSLWSVCRTIGDKVTPQSVTLGGLALVTGIYVIDQIPNANPLALIFLLSGSIAARAAAPRRRASARRSSIVHAPVPAAVEH